MPAGNTTRPKGTERVLKEEAGRGVYLVRDVHGERELVKRWPARPWEFVKLLLGIAQAQRQLRGARRLAAAGVRTPAPRGGIRVLRDGRWVVEIRLEWVEGVSLLERLSSANAGDQRRLGAALAALLARVAGAELFHRDGKLSNFIVTPDEEIVAIDPVGVRRSRDPTRERERARLALECELGVDGIARCAEFLRAVRG